MRSRMALAGFGLALAIGGAAAAAALPSGDLPAGVALKAAPDGLSLVRSDGAPLYRLDIDRAARRLRGFFGNVVDRRCGEICAKYWLPVPVPEGFKADGDWTAVTGRAGPQLAYRGDPLYTFGGKSFDEIKDERVAPSYLSGYSAKPTDIADGVPVATLYWHVAIYQPPAPKVAAPAAIGAQWVKASYVFTDAEKRSLYAYRGGRFCAGACDGLEPVPAPLTAQAVGEWRPVEDKAGSLFWAYRGRVAYRPAQDADAPHSSRWEPLEIHAAGH